MTNDYRHFLKSNFVRGSRLFALVYSDQYSNTWRLKAQRYYLVKSIIKNSNVIINGKKILWSNHWFWYKTRNKKCEEVRLTTGQGEDFNTGCLLDYDSIKNHYRLIIAVDLWEHKKN